MFISLCHMAYEGLLDGQRLVFPDLPKHLQHLQLETLGLMQAQAPLYGMEDSGVLSYHYNHLTIQEFLSAYFILQQELTEKERSEICLKFIKDGHFTMVMRFLSGLTKSTFIPQGIVRRMLGFEEGKDKLTVFHWLFEGGETSPITDILENRKMSIESDYTWTALDYFVTGWVIACSNFTWNINFSRSIMGDEGMELFIRGLCTSSQGKRGNGHIKSISLSDNDLSSQSLCHLMNVPTHIFGHLTEIDLSFNKLDRTGMDYIAKTIPHMPKLEVLNLGYDRDINRGGVVAVVSALCDHKLLKELDLSITNIGEEDCEQIANLLSCSQSLQYLHIGDNSLSSDSVEIIFKGLHRNSSLIQLDMGGFRNKTNNISLANMRSLVTYLRERRKCKLEKLDLNSCNIESETSVELAYGLGHNSSVKILDLSYNHIGDQGATALGRILRTNKALTHLSLGRCGITTTGGAALATSLLENTKLERLDIYDNALGGGDAIKTFARVLQQNKTLKVLNISPDNTPSRSDVNTLIDSLTKNQTLEELSLPRKFKVDADKRVMWW